MGKKNCCVEKKQCSQKPCDTKCDKVECTPDCCSISYQRLDKLRTGWSILNAGGSVLPLVADGLNIDGINTRNGDPIAVPTAAIFQASAQGVALATVAGAVITPVLNNAYYSYNFVNTHRYLPFENCNKLDQVFGFYINSQTGQVEIYQAFPDINLPVNVNRAELLALPAADLSIAQKCQLKELNFLYKLGLKAIEELPSAPKTEGNIVEVHYKCKKFLIAINRADGTQSVVNNNGAYTIVATEIC